MFRFTQRGGEPTTLANVLLRKLRLFERRPDLAARGTYAITSDVDPEVVDLFFARVMGDEAKVVTAANAEQLRDLSDELRFSGFDDEIRAVLDGDWKVRKDLVDLQDRVDKHDMVIEEIQRQVLALKGELQMQWWVTKRAVDVTLDAPEYLKKEIGEAKKEDEDAKSEAGDGENETEASKKELEDAKQESENAKKEVENVKRELENVKKELEDAKKESEIAKTECENAKREGQDAKQESESAKKQLDGIREC